MDPEKHLAFIEKLFEKTKAGEIKWERYSKGELGSLASNQKSFSCVIGELNIDMLVSDDDEIIEFHIVHSEGTQDTKIEAESEDEYKAALRLAKYVYGQFDALGKAIDDFLNS